MRNFNNKIIILALFAIALNFCTDEKIDSLFEVDITSLTFHASGGQESIKLTSNVEWKITYIEDWITIDPLDGRDSELISIIANQNNLSERRRAVVTLTPAKGSPVNVIITQNGIETHLETNPTEISISSKGEEQTIQLFSNTSWTVSSSESWLRVTPKTGAGNATLSVVADPNEAVSDIRTAIVSIVSTDGEKINIPIIQNAVAFQFALDEKGVSFAADGGERKVTLASNVEWYASSDQEWLTVRPSSGSSSAVLSLFATNNETAFIRSAMLTLIAKNENIHMSLPVLQAGNSEFGASETLLFPGSDFEDWQTFLNNSVNPVSIISQSNDGEGLFGSKAMAIKGTSESTQFLFRVRVPDNFSFEGKTKVSFFIKGVASPRSLVFFWYKPNLSNYYTYNLESISTKNVECYPNVGSSANDNGKIIYNGEINTQNQWVEVTLHISPEDLIYGFATTPRSIFFGIRVGADANLNLLIDHITIQ